MVCGLEYTMAIRLVLATDYLCVREALEALLQQEPDIHILAHGQSGEEILHTMRQHRPDVLILAIGMPGKGGLEVLREMRQAQLPGQVVLLAESLNDDDVLEAMLLEVEGMVLNEVTSPQLVGCIRKVYAGDHWLERGTVGRAVETMLRREAAARERAKGLTPREIEVLSRVATNLPPQACAAQDHEPV
jgi:DNA-binding NarL/FixJ family response regulator